METETRSRLREHAASKLRGVLAERRISAAAMARRLGWKQSYMARRYDGRVALDLDDMEAITAELGITILDLLPDSARVVTTPVPTAGYGHVTERPTHATHRPPNGRPPQRPDHQAGDDHPRRTSRVARASRT